MGKRTVTNLPTLRPQVWGTNSRDWRRVHCVWCPQGRPAFLTQNGVGRNTKLKISGGLVVVEQAIPEGSVMRVWEVRCSVKGTEVQGLMERMEH